MIELKTIKIMTKGPRKTIKNKKKGIKLESLLLLLKKQKTVNLI